MAHKSTARVGTYRWLVRRCLLLFVVALTASHAPASAAEPSGPPTQSFSGQMVLRSGDRPPLIMDVAHTPGKTRIDMTIAGRKLIQIVDRTAKRVFVLLPHKKVYLESTLTPRRDVVAVMVPRNAKTRKIGEEAIDGQIATKFEMTGTNPQGRSFSGHMWRTVTGNIVVQLQGTVTQPGKAPVPFRMTMKKLSLTPPAAEKFTLPAGYQRVERKK